LWLLWQPHYGKRLFRCFFNDRLSRLAIALAIVGRGQTDRPPVVLLKVTLLCLVAGTEHPTGFFKDQAECERVRVTIAQAQKPPAQACHCATVPVHYPDRDLPSR